MALYENVKRYEKINSTGYINIDELRKVLGVIKPTYEENRRFIQLLLKPSIKEVNEKTDIKIEFETKRENRKIKYIKFNIEKQKSVVDKSPISIEINPEKKIEEKKIITDRLQEIINKLKSKNDE